MSECLAWRQRDISCEGESMAKSPEELVLLKYRSVVLVLLTNWCSVRCLRRLSNFSSLILMFPPRLVGAWRESGGRRLNQTQHSLALHGYSILDYRHAKMRVNELTIGFNVHPCRERTIFLSWINPSVLSVTNILGCSKRPLVETYLPHI